MHAREEAYAVLGLPANARPEQIKDAYRSLALTFHPDHNGGDRTSEEKFKLVSSAYSALMGRKSKDPHEEKPAKRIVVKTAKSLPPSTRVSGSVTLSLPDTFQPVTAIIETQRAMACPACAGQGKRKLAVSVRCPQCHGRPIFPSKPTSHGPSCPHCRDTGVVAHRGCTECAATGRVIGKETTPVLIPSGAMNGDFLFFKTTSGHEVAVDVRVRIPKSFEIQGLDVAVTKTTAPSTAANGAVVSLHAPDGENIKIRIPPGTTDGTIMRIAGKGLLRSDGKRGDLTVRFSIRK